MTKMTTRGSVDMTKMTTRGSVDMTKMTRGSVEDDDTGVEDDDTGVRGHDEDDDTGVTRDQAAESNEQLRRFHRFRGTVHTLLRVLVERQTPDLLAVGPLDEIEDYIQRVLTSLLLPLE